MFFKTDYKNPAQIIRKCNSLVCFEATFLYPMWLRIFSEKKWGGNVNLDQEPTVPEQVKISFIMQKTNFVFYPPEAPI